MWDNKEHKKSLNILYDFQWKGFAFCYESIVRQTCRPIGWSLIFLNDNTKSN